MADSCAGNANLIERQSDESIANIAFHIKNIILHNIIIDACVFAKRNEGCQSYDDADIYLFFRMDIADFPRRNLPKRFRKFDQPTKFIIDISQRTSL